MVVSKSWVLAALLFAVPACTAGASDESAESTESEVRTSADGGDGGFVDPFTGLEGLRDGALKSALLDRIKGHRSLGYNSARKVLMRNANADGKIECVYTGRLVTPNGTTTPGDFNTEHSWPQSLGADHEPMKSDLHHLFPSDARANSARGNHPFNYVTCLQEGGPACNYSNAGSALGKSQTGQTSFEVRKERRGDIARAQFYFSVRYSMPISPAVEATLRQWHDQDPVDDTDKAKNDLVEREQRNRNPFVDHPEFVANISDF